MPGPIWKTADGREIPIEKMTDQHLSNTLKMLKRDAELQLLYYLLNVLSSSYSDPARLRMLNQAAEGGWQAYAHQQIKYLIKEVERRHLNWEYNPVYPVTAYESPSPAEDLNKPPRANRSISIE